MLKLDNILKNEVLGLSLNDICDLKEVLVEVYFSSLFPLFSPPSSPLWRRSGPSFVLYYSYMFLLFVCMHALFVSSYILYYVCLYSFGKKEWPWTNTGG